MQFTKKRVKGKRQDTFQRWVSDCGAYRVEWRAELGIPAWYATVDVGWMWTFAGKRGPYRTRKAAERACITHRKAWERYMTADRAKRAELRRLRVGKGDQINTLMIYPPAWCARDRRLGALGRKLGALQQGFSQLGASPKDAASAVHGAAVALTGSLEPRVNQNVTEYAVPQCLETAS